MEVVYPRPSGERRWRVHESMPSSVLVVSDRNGGVRIETAGDTRYVCSFEHAIDRGWVVAVSSS